jgi:hypothetical protein
MLHPSWINQVWQTIPTQLPPFASAADRDMVAAQQWSAR